MRLVLAGVVVAPLALNVAFDHSVIEPGPVIQTAHHSAAEIATKEKLEAAEAL